MIRDTSGHCRGGPATGVSQTRVWCAEIINRTDQIHTMLQRQRVARQRSATACQRREALPERRVQPLNIGRIDDSLALRPASERLHACRCPIDHAAFRRDYPPPFVALDDLSDQDIPPRTQPWSSVLT